MAQRPVLAQSNIAQSKVSRWIDKVSRPFFTEDPSPENHKIIDLQQRAIWIVLAFLLQALVEIDTGWYYPFIAPFGSLIPFALILGSFFAMWMALRPSKKTPEEMVTPSKRYRGWQRFMLLVAFVLAIIGVVELGRAVYGSFGAPQFSNDGTSLDTNAAILLTQGENPYTDSNIPELVRRFNGDIPPEWTTPLREGQFANRLNYPSVAELNSIWSTSFKADGNVPEFESKVSYPALSFLSLLPYAIAQNYNVMSFYLLCYLLIVLFAWKISHPKLRPWVLLLALANIPMWVSTVGGNLDIFYTLLLIISWIKRDQRWVSAIFLGLAMATKQISWYFVPFYIILILQHYNWKEMIYRISISGGLALAINLPFIMWDPYTFYAGIMAPVRDPMFPMGVGLIGLSCTHLLPYFPEWVYSALEYGAIAATIYVYWRICRKAPTAALLLAVIPLFFAWRSLSSYFYCVAFPIFMVMLAQTSVSTQSVFSFLKTSKSANANQLTTVRI
ncbi:MAG TPA: glycosyltransferase 87 family protein [Dictyobacter sp.]|nr:glycosyltransferase 87 family protein [Dictyobacter sp.]